ncbi:hypothetical protein [Gordonibacter sp.]
MGMVLEKNRFVHVFYERVARNFPAVFKLMAPLTDTVDLLVS